MANLTGLPVQVCDRFDGRFGEHGTGGHLVPALTALAQPGDEGLVMNAVAAGEDHRALAAAVEGGERFLALLRGEPEPAVEVGAVGATADGVIEWIREPAMHATYAAAWIGLDNTNK